MRAPHLYSFTWRQRHGYRQTQPQTRIQTDADMDTDEDGDTEFQTITARLKCDSVARLGLLFSLAFSCGDVRTSKSQLVSDNTSL
jgi:hypothetical protein